MTKINWQKFKWFRCQRLGHIPWGHKRCMNCSLYVPLSKISIICKYDLGVLFYLPADEMKRCGQNLRYMKYQKFKVVK